MTEEALARLRDKIVERFKPFLRDGTPLDQLIQEVGYLLETEPTFDRGIRLDVRWTDHASYTPVITTCKLTARPDDYKYMKPLVCSVAEAITPALFNKYGWDAKVVSLERQAFSVFRLSVEPSTPEVEP
jgi:hypothetical protein